MACRSGSGGAARPALREEPAGPGPAAFTTSRARTSCSAPVTRVADARARDAPAGAQQRDAPPRGWRRAAPASAAARRNPISSRSLLATCASCQSGPAGEPAGGEAGQRARAPRARRASGRGARRSAGRPRLRSQRQQVVQDEAQRERLPAPRAVAVGGHQERQRRTSCGRDAEQRAPLAHRLAQARHVEPLEVAQAAVDRLQAVPGGARRRSPRARRARPRARAAPRPRPRRRRRCRRRSRATSLARCERGEFALHARPAASPFE